jgi:hypothetical protein
MRIPRSLTLARCWAAGGLGLIVLIVFGLYASGLTYNDVPYDERPLVVQFLIQWGWLVNLLLPCTLAGLVHRSWKIAGLTLLMQIALTVFLLVAVGVLDK